MAATLYTVAGMSDVQRALRRAGGNELLDQLKGVHLHIANMVKGAALPKTPRRSGALAGSLRASGTRRGAIVRAGGARVPYAGIIEWGWPARYIHPRHMVAGAAKQTEASWIPYYESNLARLMNRIEHGA